MNKEQLKFHIKLCREIEDKRVDPPSDVYYKLNYIIHTLLENEFGFSKTDFLENYIYGEPTVSFDELCNTLGIEN